MIMKTIFSTALLIFLQIFFAKNLLSQCYDYACMMKNAKKYLENGQFELAFNTATAAKHYSDADEKEADDFLKEVFRQMNELKTQAEKAKTEALFEKKQAEEAESRAKKLQLRAEISEATSKSQRDSIKFAYEQVAELIHKGKVLESTFSNSNTYEYLYKTGLEYFAWDQIAQKRDYQNALTYFALARFFCPEEPQLRFFVEASQSGMVAERYFFGGKLDSAANFYKKTWAWLDSTRTGPDFEKERLKQIHEVDSLFTEFKKVHNPSTTDSAVLRGNWWTIPEGFGEFKNLENVEISENPANFSQFPAIFGKLTRLEKLRFSNCPNIRSLQDWSNFSTIKELSFSNNPSLYAIDLSKINRLNWLCIDNCTALTLIEGCEFLSKFHIKKSPQARVASLLMHNRGLKSLELSDISSEPLNLGGFGGLETLNLSELGVAKLDGLEKNNLLNDLAIAELHVVDSLRLPGNLKAIRISHCEKLTTLDLPPSDSLRKIMIFEDNRLRKLPNWEKFSNLENVAILSCKEIRGVKSLKKLKHPKEVLLINNFKIPSYSIHAGFGFDWGVKPSTLKLEVEKRGSLGVTAGDFGVKALAVYSNKFSFYNYPTDNSRESKGIIGGLAFNYYSPYRFYYSLGVGGGRFTTLQPDLTHKTGNKFVWVNNLGYQIAPYFLRKDKLSLNMDLYTIFDDFNNYDILPSFGLTYYRTLGMKKNTHFLRPSDHRQHLVRSRWHPFDDTLWKEIKKLPDEF